MVSSSGYIGIIVHSGLRGITSLIRALGLKEIFYDRILDFFHSHAINLETLTFLWCYLILKLLPQNLLPKVNNRLILIGD